MLVRTDTRAAPFDNLSRGLEKAWDMVRKDGKLTSENIKEPMLEIRRALLEADVSLPVVRGFVSKVEKAALGAEVTKGVTPDQQLVKVVYDQLRELMGGSVATLAVTPSHLDGWSPGYWQNHSCCKIGTLFEEERSKSTACSF